MAEPPFYLLNQQERQEGIPGLFSPEELALARAASMVVGDQEMMADVYNKLDPRVSPGGDLGVLTSLGEKDAVIKTYTADGEYPAISTLGSYNPRKVAVDEAGFAVNPSGGYDLDSQARMLRGMDPPRPGEIFLQQVTQPEADRIVEAQRKISASKGPSSEMTSEELANLREDLVNPRATLLHEFTHRAIDSPMYDDFVKWAESNLEEEDVQAVKFPTLSRANEEFMAEDLDLLASGREPQDSRMEERLVRINDAMRKFLTPERQEKYGFRTPIRSRPPKPVERGIMDFVRNMIGMSKGGAPTDQMELFRDILDLLPAARSLKVAKKTKKGIETLSKKRKPSQQLEKIAPNKKMREALEAKRKKQSKQVDETMAKALENSKKPKKKTKSKVKIDRSEPKRFDSDENPKDRALRERLKKRYTKS
jgi:hypothetical protein